ncbi:MAG: hypothetical protein CVV05_13580 [Gammaproteobacteria bacterium HGW-Gammaproteobacteria-1]|jgi:hypothetical protein|nr:MAG: hypothetical protein CVV05_13580 [Gammaproteobacteria bacterium HGW-Gammaproteobacteria-1]
MGQRMRAGPDQAVMEREREIGAVAQRLHLLTAEQVQAALAARAAKPLDDEHDAGLVYVEEGLLSRAQLDYVETVRRFKSVRVSEKRFGDLVVVRGWATAEQVHAAMEVQKMLFMREHKEVMIGEMLVRQHVITAEQRDILLQVQHRARQEELPAKTPHPSTLSPAQPSVPSPSAAAADVPPPAASEPAPQPAAPGGFSISIAENALAAFITLHDGAQRPDPDALRHALHMQHIDRVDEPALLQACAPDAPLGQPLCVAQGSAPQAGSDASLDYLFELHPLKPGRETDDTIDFRDRGDIPQVAEGAVLARKTAAVDGVPGRDVYGRVLKVAKVRDVRIQAGNGAQLEPDRLTITAQVAGHPVLTASGIIAVHPEFRIDGDLGYNTGHVDFAGRVIVSGTVQNGFHVKCGELMAGEIEGGEIEASGDVLVSGGVIGARIRADGAVKAKYFHTSHVEALGDVIVQREVVESAIETSGVFHGEACTLLASSVSAKGGVIVQEVGSASSQPCRLTVGIDERVLHQIAQHEADIAERVQALAAMAEEQAALAQQRSELGPRIAVLAQVQDKAQVRLRELEPSVQAGEGKARDLHQLLTQQAASTEEEITALFAAQDAAESALAALQVRQHEAQEQAAAWREEIVRLREWSNETPGRAEIKVQKTACQGTAIRAVHSELRLAEDKKCLWLEEREVTGEEGDTGWGLMPKG